MSETPPPQTTDPPPHEGAAEEEKTPAKSAWKSRTVWLNLVAVASALLPTVQEWLAENPVQIVSAFAAVNVLVRFVTNGKISIFGKTGGAARLCVLGFAGLAAFGLTSCADYSMRGTASWRDAQTGAKGGVRFEPGYPPLPYLRIPVQTQNGSGYIDIVSEK